jgi:drug/metabolite transporter (DMT)-like permease
MEPGEALSTAAQIAVALAGFAGVVVVFRTGSLHEWSPVDKFRLWLLLGNALLALFACLIGMLLLAIKPTPVSIWRWCSGLSLLLVVPFALLSRRRQLEIGRSVVKEMGSFRYVFFLFGAVGAAVSGLQIYNALNAGVFWLFYASIVFPLAIGTLQFARMILLPPHTSTK